MPNLSHLPDISGNLSPEQALTMRMLREGGNMNAMGRCLAYIGTLLPPDHAFNRRLLAYATRANGFEPELAILMHPNHIESMLFGNSFSAYDGSGPGQGYAMFRATVSDFVDYSGNSGIVRRWGEHTNAITPVDRMRQRAARFTPSLGAM